MRPLEYIYIYIYIIIYYILAYIKCDVQTFVERQSIKYPLVLGKRLIV
jgi:hypothetical protein